MRILLLLLLLLLSFTSALQAQPAIDEEKVKKAVIIMKKMMEDPGAMQNSLADMQALKLNSAENKEAKQRFQQLAMGQANKIKETAAAGIGTSGQPPRGNGVPVRNAAKIAAIPATPTPAGLPAHLVKLSKAVEAALPPVVQQEAIDAYNQLAKECKNAKEMGEGVIGLWLSGHNEHAAVVAGRVCMADPSLAENINNYAALLNMLNAQQMAVPLLQLLNKQYPGNPTILGNLGQSWYGLGEMTKAAQFLDSAMKIAPWHSQANNTKSKIQEQQGDKAGAAESIKASLQTGYTDEKAARLRKTGFTGKSDPPWPLHIPQDPLGFNKFNLPPFPYDIEQCKQLKSAWDDHWRKMRDLENETGVVMTKRQAEAEKYEVNAMQNNYNAHARGIAYPGAGPLSSRATAKLSYLLNDKDGGLSYKLRKAEDKLVKLGDQLRDLDNIRSKAIDNVIKQQECPDGEGSSGAAATVCCEAINRINNEWVGSSNKLMREAYEEAIDLYKRVWSAQAYFAQYTMSEPSFEAAKAQLKHLYAGVLSAVRPVFTGPSDYCDNKGKAGNFQPAPLQNFDDVACKYYSRLNFKFLVIESNCSRMKTSVDFGKLKFSFTEDLTHMKGMIPGNIIAGSADVSISIGNKGLGKWGPIKAEAGAGVDLHIEVTDQGISEVSATVKADITVSTDMLDKAQKIESVVKNGGSEYMKETGTTIIVPVPGAGNKSASIAGASATVSLNSGSSVSGSGVLGGLKL